MQSRADKRIWELDFARGVAILLMFVVHFAYAAYAAGGMIGITDAHPLWAFAAGCRRFYLSAGGKATQMLCGILFAVLSGTTASLASPKRCLYKAVKYFLIAMCLTVATRLASVLFAAKLTIVFGVLHMLSVSAAVYTLVRLITIRGPAWLKVYLPAALGVVIVGVHLVFDLRNLPLDTNLFAPLGITGRKFFSADYYPLIPWTGVYLLGAALGTLLYPTKRSLFPKANIKLNRPLCVLGRFSIQFYLIHQVALIAIFCGLYILTA